MPRTFVALDLETTGLNPTRDAIIEVGAIKFRDGQQIESYGTLINPGRPIPYEITMLTGITDHDVLGEPAFERIAPQLTRFVGALPVVGHNVGFDLGFVARATAPDRQRRAGHLGAGDDPLPRSTQLQPGQSGRELRVPQRKQPPRPARC